MNTQSNLSLANRKQLADIVGDNYNGLRSKAKHQYSERAEMLRNQFVSEYAKKEGAAAMLKEISTLQAQLDAKQTLLRAKGLCVLRGEFRLHDDAPDSVEELINKQVEEKIGTRGDIDKRFDSAQVKLLTIGTLEDARTLIESLVTV